MSRYSGQTTNHFGRRVDPGLFNSMNNAKKLVSQEPKPHQAIQMASRSTVLTNSFFELSQTRGTLDCIREDDTGHASQQSDQFFKVSANQHQNRNASPVSSDCRWGLAADDESQSSQDERHRYYKKICLMIGVVCFISIGGLVLSILILVGFLGSSSGCPCSTNSQVPPQSELQKQVKIMDKIERNMSDITTIMREQNQELQRLANLLRTTRNELQLLKETTENPVSMTTEKTIVTEPTVLQNTTNMTSSVSPSNTPYVNPIEISLEHLWAAHNDSIRELAQLYIKIRNISLIPGPMGPQGETGTKGPPGPLGPGGSPGRNGTRGPVGPKGPIGPRGYNGTRGPPGVQGLPGPKGPIGVQGPEGRQGPEGPRGYNGSRGPPGPRGVDGPQGNQGNTGPRGSQGLQGPAGPPGPRGAGNFSQCVYKRADSNSSPSDQNSHTSVLVSEPAGRRIIGTVCSTNNAQEYILESAVRLGIRKYVCSCRGLSSHFGRLDRQMYCYMHYWECPLSS